MTNEERPAPEDFLNAIKREESDQNRGRLKIFLGMAAGVGKTYHMLEEARALHNEGIDVVVGIVDTHGRAETAALLNGLKNVPPKAIKYRDKEFYELDLDAILSLRPKVVLVDELAHSNIPGTRHAKRWEDIIEILDNGIDVYTTLNVQHIESLRDVVEGITGVSIRETVPDSIIEKAAHIQLVDLTPDKLLQRLKEGRVYLGDQSRIASLNFFQKDRLTALREVVLRFTAEKVDHDLHGMVPAFQREAWRAREKLLVAVSHSPHSQKLIRTARRIAFRLDAPWIALHVNDGTILKESDHNQLEKNLALARELGGEVITTNDPDIGDAIQRVAQQRSVTQIIIGRPPEKSWLDFFRRTSLLDTLARECSDIDVHVIRQDKPSASRKKLSAISSQESLKPYFTVFFWVALISGICWYLEPLMDLTVVGVIFILGILSLSLFFRKGPIFFAAILFAVIWNYGFVSENMRFDVGFNTETALLILFFLTAIVTGVLVDRAREYKEMLAKREESAQALYEVLRSIVSSQSSEDMIKSVTEKLGKLLNGQFEILIKKFDGSLSLEEEGSVLVSEAKEKGVATWSFENGKEAGWSTSTLPMAKNLYIPLKGSHEIVGIVVFRPNTYRLLTTEQKNFLYTVGQQLANFLERTLSEERVRHTEHLKQVEKIYHTVLKSISHEFQHPLSAMRDAIYEAFQALKYEQSAMPKKGVVPQIHKIEQTSSGMQHMLDNVSVMAKLSSGFLPLNKQPHQLSNIVERCVNKIKPFLTEKAISVDVQSQMPIVNCDLELLEIVINHLLRNAINYSPPNSHIKINAEKLNGQVVLSVNDQGNGIPPEMLDAIFNEFYRVPGTSQPGMGLGLSICRRIAEIHDGRLIAENLPEGGAKFSLFLPTSGNS